MIWSLLDLMVEVFKLRICDSVYCGERYGRYHYTGSNYNLALSF